MSLTTSRPLPSKCGLICSFIKTDIKQAFQQTRRFLTRDKLHYVAKETYNIPDSSACSKALNMVASCSDTFLLNHCLRSYAFGVAMAHKVSQPFDKEVLFLGSIMHDLGLTDKHIGTQTFELDGAVAARGYCQEYGIDATKSDLVHEMVALHNAVGIADKLDPEIALLHYGAGVDVIGLGLKDIHKNTLSEILSEYPRLDFKEGFSKLMIKETKTKPHSYMSTLLKLGFVNKLKNMPF